MARSWLALVNTLCLVLHVQPCTCGEAEIIGGKKVKAHSLPYMALLYNSKGESCMWRNPPLFHMGADRGPLC
ncbi:unnamed protein product [Boreogadus saida]